MSSEKTLITTHNQCDYGASEGANRHVRFDLPLLQWLCHIPPHRRAVQTVLHLPLHMFTICSLDRLRLAHATLSCAERALEHVVEVEFGGMPIPNH